MQFPVTLLRDKGGGFTVTGGNFLSYMGYEAFDIPNMDQITYGSTIFAISGYHSGVKVDYSDANVGSGVGNRERKLIPVRRAFHHEAIIAIARSVRRRHATESSS